MSQLYPLLFENNLRSVVWGGHRLKPLKGLPPDEEPIGESWEVSAVEGRESIVSNGLLRGRCLSEVVTSNPTAMLGQRVAEMYGGRFPLLIKLIDAEKDLSIQVHPNDELARQRHGCLGKTEMWFVLDASPEAFLYSGFASPISKYEYNKRVEDGSICEVLRKHRVKKGDVFFIPAGRVHAIGGGIMLAEIQQSSDITYRIFDYNRPGLDGQLRELHTELARDAIDYKVYNSYLTNYEERENKPNTVAECPFFTTKTFMLTRAFHRKLYKYDSFIIYICLEGGFTVECKPCPENAVHLGVGYTCLVPASVADLTLIPDSNLSSTRLIEVYIDNKHFN